MAMVNLQPLSVYSALWGDSINNAFGFRNIKHLLDNPGHTMLTPNGISKRVTCAW